MLVPASRHFLYQRFVSIIERLKPADPALGLRMLRIAALAFVLGENIPKAVELAVLAEQMLPAQSTR